MESHHNGQLYISNDPKHFLLYDLVAPQKVNNFQFVYGSDIDAKKLTEEESDSTFHEMIDFCGINALLAPKEIIEHYFPILTNYVKDPQVCKEVVDSMDQWSFGFIAVWDYDIYQKDYQLLITATDNKYSDIQHLISEVDKQKYQFTAEKVLPREWEKVNLTDIIHPKTGINFYANNNDAFLIHALHKLDKKAYEIFKEKVHLETSINELENKPIKAKL
jgi:hypothetical protein